MNPLYPLRAQHLAAVLTLAMLPACTMAQPPQNPSLIQSEFTPAPISASRSRQNVHTLQNVHALQKIHASYYGRELAGKRTASGERFNPADMTAAHRTLPFGTKLRITNPRNGRSVIVRVNDRGPFVKGRGIDVSLGAAQSLGFIGQGTAQLEMEVL